MLKIKKDPALDAQEILLGVTEVTYPSQDQWRPEAFYALAEAEIAALKEQYAGYDRKAVFGEHPYYRFFKKFKKTYPVMLQLESLLFKDRPFPRRAPAAEVPFLAEVKTLLLSGAHDADALRGTLELYLSQERTPFPGMRGEEAHTYPGDVCGRDEEGIILSLIAGADARTCVSEESLHVFYPVFGVPGFPSGELRAFQAQLEEYIQVLCPTAAIAHAIY